VLTEVTWRPAQLIRRFPKRLILMSAAYLVYDVSGLRGSKIGKVVDGSVEEARASRERSSDLLGPEFCAARREMRAKA
jgi:hypothetical protein